MLSNPYGYADWSSVAPVFITGGVALIVLLADLVARKNAPRYVSLAIGIAGLLAAGVWAGLSYPQAYDAFSGGFILGGFSIVFEEVIIISAIFSLVLYSDIGRDDRIAGITALILWSTAGAMLMAGAANLMTIFLGLELLSLGLYCLCGLADRQTAREAALKYLILSSTASGFLLFGMALLFGASGSVALGSLASPAVAGSPLYWIGGGLFLIGLAFRLELGTVSRVVAGCL